MLTQEQIEKIKELFAEGKQKKDIAKEIGCSLPTVTKYTGELTIKEDIIGKKFGRLTVLKRAEKDPSLKSRCIRYECQCECGNIVIVNSNSLKTGHTTSCGCSRKGKNIKDITGQTFNKITVIKKEEINQERRAVWRCRCECGNEFLVSRSSLLIENKIKSCGCLKESLGEYKVRQILEKLKIDFKTQYKIAECKNKNPLPFDFAIFNEDKLIALIEYQGDIHFISTGGWNNEDSLLKRQQNDFIKEQYCKENNIKLIKINYFDYEKINEEYLRKVIYD